MAELNFKIDKSRDLENIWETATSSSRWYDFKQHVSQNIVKMCEGKNFEECEIELDKLMSHIYKTGLLEIYIDALQKAWNLINGRYFNRMEKIFNKKFPFENVNVYLTTSGRCPYDPDEPSFMVSFFYSIPGSLSVCGHELMHIFFHNTYWNDVAKEIGEDKTADLKEALTVLLNLEFSDLWITPDEGYESHQELRNFIVEKWSEEKDFEKLLSKCIKYLKD